MTLLLFGSSLSVKSSPPFQVGHLSDSGLLYIEKTKQSQGLH